MILLTTREREILQLAAQDLSDYKIARKLDSDPPTVTRSRRNALKKLKEAEKTLAWAKKVGYSTHPKLSPN